jgi:peptidoglycan/xylan/chitin deacetylase (PgdA/CDA1 family)
MDYLSKNYHPVSLADLLQLLKNPGKMPDRCVAVTFDDGYADNLHHAKPILEKYHIPATIFVTTGMIGSSREFWWDDLERILLLPEDLPGTLDLKIRGKEYHWTLTDTQEGTNHREKPKNGIHFSTVPWDVTMGSLPTSQHQVYCDLHRLLRPLNSVDRDNILQQLCIWAGIPETGRSDYRALTREEISDLARSEFIDIGSHGQTHPLLKTQSSAIQEIEISDSKKNLQQNLNREITGFSYPFGGREDFSSQTMRFVKNTGYTFACANFPGPVIRWTNHYALPRYLVRNWNKDQFSGNISMWYNG